MIRKTDIKRLWDVLMILKQEEDIDDVRKRAKSVQYTDAGQAAVAAKIKSSALADKEFQARQAEQAQTQGTRAYPYTAPSSSGLPPSDPPAGDTPSGPPAVPSAASPGEAVLTEWEGRKDLVKPAGGGMHPGGGAYSSPEKVTAPKPSMHPGGGAYPLKKSLKKSNESRILKIFRKYGF
jgi:hypothetical protein